MGMVECLYNISAIRGVFHLRILDKPNPERSFGKVQRRLLHHGCGAFPVIGQQGLLIGGVAEKPAAEHRAHLFSERELRLLILRQYFVKLAFKRQGRVIYRDYGVGFTLSTGSLYCFDCYHYLTFVGGLSSDRIASIASRLLKSTLVFVKSGVLKEKSDCL